MALQEFLANTQVFTSHDIARAFPDSQTDRNLLTRAVQRGGVERVRRGLYVSKTGPFSHTRTDPFDIANAVAADATFCLMSALQLQGVSHDLVNRIQFYSHQHISPFGYDGFAYEPHRLNGQGIATQSVFTSSGKVFQATTREQTLVDCLVQLTAAGGPEHLLRSLSGFTFLDAATAVRLTDSASLTVKARLGWVLEAKREDWQVADGVLASLQDALGGGPYYFYSSASPRDQYWVKRWKLYLPYPEQEMHSWLNL